MAAGTDRMDVCVAICTWNRSELLRQTLDSLTQLRVGPGTTWEVLVVNNNCTDDTDAVVKRFETVLPIRVVHELQPGLSNARNRALRDCRAGYIVFTDDDVQVADDWLSVFVAATRAYPSAGVFGGAIEPWFQTPPDPELLAAFPIVAKGFCGVDYERHLGPLPPDCQLAGANLAFRVAAIGGHTFDPALGVNQNLLGGGEELAFIAGLRAEGHEVIWVPGMRVRHYVDPARLTLPYLIRFTRDRGRVSVREKGAVTGRTVAGAPAWLWMRYATAFASAVTGTVTQSRIRAAARWARAESYRAKIGEYRALSRRSGRH